MYFLISLIPIFSSFFLYVLVSYVSFAFPVVTICGSVVVFPLTFCLLLSIVYYHTYYSQLQDEFLL
jgi:hypothetical protein